MLLFATRKQWFQIKQGRHSWHQLACLRFPFAHLCTGPRSFAGVVPEAKGGGPILTHIRGSLPHMSDIYKKQTGAVEAGQQDAQPGCTHRVEREQAGEATQ